MVVTENFPAALPWQSLRRCGFGFAAGFLAEIDFAAADQLEVFSLFELFLAED